MNITIQTLLDNKSNVFHLCKSKTGIIHIYAFLFIFISVEWIANNLICGVFSFLYKGYRVILKHGSAIKH